MKIEVSGIHHYELSDADREAVTQRFQRVAEQVSELAVLDVQLFEEANPRITKEKMVCEATLTLKGATIRATEAQPEMIHAIHQCAEDIRRQVTKHNEKLRGR